MKTSFRISGLMAICFTAICSSGIYAQPPNNPEIWICPQGLPTPSGHLSKNDDFMDMFTPSAPWQNAAAHTQVFKIPVTKLAHTSQDQLKTIIADLNRRQIKLALEAGAMNVGPSKDAPCGGMDMEGYGTPKQAKMISQMIKNAGGQVAYIAMDEPMIFGHFKTGVHTNATGNKLTYCNSSVDQVVSLVAPTLNAYIEEFPNVLIGDIEPTEMVIYPTWQNDFQDWATKYKATMQRPLAFIHLDIPWNMAPPSKEPADTLEIYNYMQGLQQQGLIGKIGVIWNGQPKDPTDAAWVQGAQHHVMVLEGQYGLRFDQVVFQSWVLRPTHAMPDSAPDTLTGLVNWYLTAPRQ